MVSIGGLDGNYFDAQIFHPAHKPVHVTGDFPMLRLPVWANEVTFSPEPYYQPVLGPGDSVEWSMCYDWGQGMGATPKL
jgi:hypothetical protein